MTPRPEATGSRGRLRVEGPSLALRYPATARCAGAVRAGQRRAGHALLLVGPYRDEDEPRAWLRSLPGRRASGTALELAIVDASDRPIGIILLSELSARDRRAVVGTWLGRTHWGTGANAEAKALIAALAFGPLGLRRIAAYADAQNARSQAALRRLGFTREGRAARLSPPRRPPANRRPVLVAAARMARLAAGRGAGEHHGHPAESLSTLAGVTEAGMSHGLRRGRRAAEIALPQWVRPVGPGLQ